MVSFPYQVHGMNCLRMLVLSHELAKPIQAYIGDLLKMAIQNARSPSWALRNCANMLLAAVIRRVFNFRGQNAEANERILTYKHFTFLYPGIHDFLVDYLKQSQFEVCFFNNAAASEVRGMLTVKGGE
jgi:hypothetical protein